jgi:hypothetical protein
MLRRLLALTATSATLLTVAPSPVAASPLVTPESDQRAHFDFHSNFWVNLHHFLYVTARARSGLDASRPAVTVALVDTAGFGALSASEQEAWQAAVAYYRSSVATRDVLFDPGMVSINNQLASLADAQSPAGTSIDAPLAAVLSSAAPVYRKLWWTRHDAGNRAWIAEMQRMLGMYGDSLATQEARAMQTPWQSTPVRVDVTAYANWAGAYTSNKPAHITVASAIAANQGEQGFEILFHEVLHTMAYPLLYGLDSAFKTAGKPMPRDPTHPFIFYTAGALTQRAIPGHVTYGEKNAIWTRVPDYRKAYPLLQQTWQPYLDGQITLHEALRRYAEAQ